jgi:hypothetical protein
MISIIPLHPLTFHIVGDSMSNFSLGQVKRLAQQANTLSDKAKKNLLSSLDTEVRLLVIEELVNIKIQNGRKNND